MGSTLCISAAKRAISVYEVGRGEMTWMMKRHARRVHRVDLNADGSLTDRTQGVSKASKRQDQKQEMEHGQTSCVSSCLLGLLATTYLRWP